MDGRSVRWFSAQNETSPNANLSIYIMLAIQWSDMLVLGAVQKVLVEVVTVFLDCPGLISSYCTTIITDASIILYQ